MSFRINELVERSFPFDCTQGQDFGSSRFSTPFRSRPPCASRSPAWRSASLKSMDFADSWSVMKELTSDCHRWQVSEKAGPSLLHPIAPKAGALGTPAPLRMTKWWDLLPS